jgi:hypothetical protein
MGFAVQGQAAILRYTPKIQQPPIFSKGKKTPEPPGVWGFFFGVCGIFANSSVLITNYPATCSIYRFLHVSVRPSAITDQ